jgi:prepilin-type N-terminal cleavage/methylation domain-containing protein
MLASATRRAVTLVEVLIVMAIIGVIAAVLYPAVSVQLRRGQASALANQLNNLRQSIASYRTNVTKYPTVLTQLTVQPVAGETDLCATALTAANRAAWRGPYITQNIVGNMPVGEAAIQNDILRNPPTTAGGPIGLLQIVSTGVDVNSATDLEAEFDGNNNFATGTILYNAGTGTLTFQIPIRNC